MDQITRDDVESFKTARKQEEVRNTGHVVSNATVNRALSTLKRLYNRAKQKYHGLENPALGVKLLKEEPRQRVITREGEARY